ncbi:MAG: hypothetical protein L3J95_02180 [Thermoplasmata archaeon]|nr:hypothetical protein [Thermoplasmata archaeon]MCI4359218.1 hypothetical protein [Thermoplasmata archaeon]
MTAITLEEERLLNSLRRAVEAAPGRVREVEVGVGLSIALGKRRATVSCGGCSNPLEFEGIPARTNRNLKAPYRLVLDTPDQGR